MHRPFVNIGERLTKEEIDRILDEVFREVMGRRRDG